MVITGKDKNTKGKITVAFPKTGKVIVEGVNMVTRHQKARNAMQPGGIVKKEAAIDASNVMLICPKCGKPTRVSHKVNVAVDANGKKNRTELLLKSRNSLGQILFLNTGSHQTFPPSQSISAPHFLRIHGQAGQHCAAPRP